MEMLLKEFLLLAPSVQMNMRTGDEFQLTTAIRFQHLVNKIQFHLEN